MREYPIQARIHNNKRAPVPLSDEKIRQFIANGHLVLRSSLPRSYHDLIFERIREINHGYGHFGNNLLPLLPELNEFFEDPVVKGALQSVLGSEYHMHPHRALHSNPPGSEEQQFHKDSYWGYVRRVRNHRPWWVMIMYFPQDTGIEKGPTAVMGGSQFLNQRPEQYCEEVSADGKAGTFLLIHYDIWHRKMLNQTDLDRYMFKFEFTRLKPPVANGRTSNPWRRPRLRSNGGPDMTPTWRSIWSWLNGDPTLTEVNQAASVEQLGSDNEAEGVSAAYNIAANSNGSLQLLLESLDSNPVPYNEGKRYSDNGAIWRADATVRNAAYGLSAVGSRAIDGLTDILRSGTERGRKHAAFALGEIGKTAGTAALAEATQDSMVHVRIAAIEALGLVPPVDLAIDAMVDALGDSASEVRFDAALSLMRATTRAKRKSLARTVDPLASALYDTNRYVSGYAAEALQRIGTQEALAHLLPYLQTARWCAHTDNRRPF